MADGVEQFLVEILIRASENVSGAAGKALDAVGKLTGAQEKQAGATEQVAQAEQKAATATEKATAATEKATAATAKATAAAKAQASAAEKRAMKEAELLRAMEKLWDYQDKVNERLDRGSKNLDEYADEMTKVINEARRLARQSGDLGNEIRLMFEETARAAKREKEDAVKRAKDRAKAVSDAEQQAADARAARAKAEAEEMARFNRRIDAALMETLKSRLAEEKRERERHAAAVAESAVQEGQAEIDARRMMNERLRQQYIAHIQSIIGLDEDAYQQQLIVARAALDAQLDAIDRVAKANHDARVKDARDAARAAQASAAAAQRQADANAAAAQRQADANAALAESLRQVQKDFLKLDYDVARGAIVGGAVEAGFKRIEERARRLAGSFTETSNEFQLLMNVVDGARRSRGADRDRDMGGGGGGGRGIFQALGGGGGGRGGIFSAAAENVAGLNAELRGFAIAFAIKYAQAIITAGAGVITTLSAIAMTAIQAGAALGASLASGAAQAVPVLGLLAAAGARVGSVLEAVKQANKLRMTEGRDDEGAAERARTAAISVRNANEAVEDAERRLADAHERVKEAQERVTDAREEARLELERLVLAEERARISAERASLSVEQAQRNLKRAIREGDVENIRSAELDVEDAQMNVKGVAQDRRDIRRQRANVGDRVDQAVKGREDALRGVADAERALARATQSAADAQASAAAATSKRTAAQDMLQAMLEDLTPAERKLYESILAFQKAYREAVRPITDILVGAFQRGVDRATEVLGDSKLMSSLAFLAESIAGVIDTIIEKSTNEESRNFFALMADEAARNLPILAKIASDFFDIAKSVATAAVPAFRDLLEIFRQLAQDGRKETGDTSGLASFFRTGIRYAKRFLDLGFAVIDLFLALSGPGGGAESGEKAIGALTEKIRDAAAWIRSHADEVRDFFGKAFDVTKDVASVLWNIAKEVVNVFSSPAVAAFAEVLRDIVIPAIGDAIKIIGFFTTILHQIMSLPLVKEFLQFAATILIVTKAFMIFAGALAAIRKLAAVFFMMFKTNPIIAAIIAIGAAILLLDRKFHFLKPTLEWLKKAMGDVFDWIKGAVEDVAKFFSDAWRKGMLVPLRLILTALAGYIRGWIGIVVKIFSSAAFADVFQVLMIPLKAVVALFRSLWDVVKGAFLVVTRLFRGDWKGAGEAFLDIWRKPLKRLVGFFSDAWDSIKQLFTKDFAKKMLSLVRELGKGLRSGFNTVFDGIKSIFTAGLRFVFDLMTSIFNGIIGAANKVISAFNKISPKNLPEISVRFRTWDQIQTLAAARRGEETSNYDGPRATGGYERARSGGKLVKVVEGGHDEVILTTDPKHAPRQRQLLGRYLSAAPWVLDGAFAEGGYVQGAAGRPARGAAHEFAKKMFKLGYNVTSALRNTHTHHGTGSALDFGDSVNNLRNLWKVLFPLRGNFAEMFGPTYSSKGIGYYFGQGKNIAGTKLQRNHEDHIHIAILDAVRRGVKGLTNSMTTAAVQLPAIFNGAAENMTKWVGSVLGKRPDVKDMGSLGGATGYRAASRMVRYLAESAMAMAAQSGVTAGLSVGSDADSREVATTIFKVGRRMNVPFKHLLAAFETGIVESGMRNLSYGDASSVGWRQELDTYGSVAERMNVAAGAQRFFNEARQFDREGLTAGQLAAAVQRPAAQYRGRYDAVRDQALALLREIRASVEKKSRKQQYSSGGVVEGGWGDAVDITAHGGEWVMDPPRQARLAGMFGTTVSGAARMLGLKPNTTGRFQDGGIVAGVGRYASRVPGLSSVGKDMFSEAERFLATFLNPLPYVESAKRFGKRVRTTFSDLLGEGGVLERLAAVMEEISTSTSDAIKRASFGKQGGVFVRRDLSARARMGMEYTGLRRQRGVLNRAGALIDSGLERAEEDLEKARAQGNQSAINQLVSAINKLKQRKRENQRALGDNLEALVTKQEEMQQATVDAVDAQFSKFSSALDTQQRLQTALGNPMNAGQVASKRIGAINSQIDDLSKVRAEAKRTGNKTLEDTLTARIDGLIADRAEQQLAAFQAKVENVNTTATDALAGIDFRMESTKEGSTSRADLLRQRGDVLLEQRMGLMRLLDDARSREDVTRMKELQTALNGVDSSLRANSQAIKDNTKAANEMAAAGRAAQASGTGAVGNSLLSYWQTVAEALGIDTRQQQRDAMKMVRSSLLATGGNAKMDILTAATEFFGGNQYVAEAFSKFQGADLINYLSTLASPDKLAMINEFYGPDAVTRWTGLINALIDNEKALIENTKATEELAGQNTDIQQFSSTGWQWFRKAFFNGLGQPMPEFASLVSMPGSPAGMQTLASRSGVSGAGSLSSMSSTTLQKPVTNYWNITSPTEVADPVQFADSFAFRMRNSSDW